MRAKFVKIVIVGINFEMGKSKELLFHTSSYCLPYGSLSFPELKKWKIMVLDSISKD